MSITYAILIASAAFPQQAQQASQNYLDCTRSIADAAPASLTEMDFAQRLDRGCTREREAYRRIAMAAMQARGDSAQQAQAAWQMMENGNRAYMRDVWRARHRGAAW